MATRSEILKVPGVRLYYEVQGSGPVLLMIPGGPTDAGIFAGLAGLLASRFTVASPPRSPKDYGRCSRLLTLKPDGAAAEYSH